MIHLKVRVRLNRVVHQFHKRVFRNLRPSGETKPAARLENTGRFGASALRISEMKKRKVRGDAIKAGIRKRKILRVALTKFDPGKHFLRNRDHFGGKIETDQFWKRWTKSCNRKKCARKFCRSRSGCAPTSRESQAR